MLLQYNEAIGVKIASIFKIKYSFFFLEFEKLFIQFMNENITEAERKKNL